MQRTWGRVVDWGAPLGLGLVLCLVAPLRTALQFGADEGYELMKAFLVSLGHPLYSEVWNDQPPLHTELLALLFRMFGPSALVGRLLTVGFAMVLVGALYRLVTERSGRVAGLAAVLLLASASSFLQLSVSVMLELPAMTLGLAAVWAWSRHWAALPTGSDGRRAEDSVALPISSQERRAEDSAALPVSCILSRLWRNRWLLLSGVCFGCALQIKFTAVIFLPALAVDYLVRRVWATGRERVGGLERARAGSCLTTPAHRRDAKNAEGTKLRSLSALIAPLRLNLCAEDARDAMLWCGSVIAAFGAILLAFYRLDTLPVFWASHFSAGTLQATAPEGYSFRLGSLLNDLALLVPAALGLVLIGWKRRWDLLLPVVLLATAFSIHLWHRPYWSYYHLHFVIPLAWLGAIGIVEWLWVLWQRDARVSLAAKLRLGVELLGWSLAVSTALTLAPLKVWDELTLLSAAPAAAEDPTVVEFRKHAAGTHWVFTDRVLYAFWAGLPVPPELAVVPSKRVWSGQLSATTIRGCLERYRPELLLVQPGWADRWNLADYLAAHYQAGPAESLGDLYVRKQ